MNLKTWIQSNLCNTHPRCLKYWLLLTGCCCSVVVLKTGPYNRGLYRQVVVSTGLTVTKKYNFLPSIIFVRIPSSLLWTDSISSIFSSLPFFWKDNTKVRMMLKISRVTDWSGSSHEISSWSKSTDMMSPSSGLGLKFDVCRSLETDSLSSFALKFEHRKAWSLRMTLRRRRRPLRRNKLEVQAWLFRLTLRFTHPVSTWIYRIA